MATPAAAKTDRGYREATRQYNGVLIREAGCKRNREIKKSGVGREDIALVYKTTGSRSGGDRDL